MFDEDDDDDEVETGTDAGKNLDVGKAAPQDSGWDAGGVCGVQEPDVCCHILILHRVKYVMFDTQSVCS